MARRTSAMVGVDVGAKELRAVELSPDGKGVKRFASVALGSIGVDRGVPTDPNTLAESLRQLFRDLSPVERKTVFGIPAAAVTSRVLDVPQVPDHELKVILDGEVQHYGIVRGFGGMFDFARLARNPKDTEASPQALVMACEAIQLNSIRDAAERARIEKAGIEPSLLGLMRLAVSRGSQDGLGVFVALAGEVAEVALVHHGSLWLYRHIDLTVEGTDDSFLRSMTGESTPSFIKGPDKQGRQEQLGIELKRTLDYISREFKDAGSVTRIVFAVSQLSEAQVVTELSETLGVPTELATAPLPGDDGIRFGAAYGLAIGSTLTSGLPAFDLSPYDPVEEAHQKQRKILATSLIASIILVVGGLAGGFFFGRKANGLTHDLTHEQEELASLQSVQLPEMEKRQAKLEQYRALSAFGLPLPQVVDAIATGLDPKTGLQEIEISGTSLKVTGEAVDEASMIRTLNQIRTTRGFLGAFIESFDQKTEPTRKYVEFRLTAQLGSTSPPPEVPKL